MIFNKTVQYLALIFALIPVSLSGDNASAQASNPVSKAIGLQVIIVQHTLDSAKNAYQRNYQEVEQTLIKNYELTHKQSSEGNMD